LRAPELIVQRRHLVAQLQATSWSAGKGSSGGSSAPLMWLPTGRAGRHRVGSGAAWTHWSARRPRRGCRL